VLSSLLLLFVMLEIVDRWRRVVVGEEEAIYGSVLDEETQIPFLISKRLDLYENKNSLCMSTMISVHGQNKDC
jgi:hypothetical protein